MATSPYDAPTFDHSKSKVVQYISLADDHDEPYGHGTHVVGTAVGRMGEGWPAHPVTDVCQDPTDTISQCVLSDFYSDCADLTVYCGEGTDDYLSEFYEPLVQNYCLNTCQCTAALNGEKIFKSGGYDASELIADSNGVAYAAKVAFYDLGNEDGDMFVPYDIGETLFPPAYAAGARVHR